jgi:two-component system, NtrC family, sensor kinase
VLKVISRSTFDLQAVLDTLTESAALLCGADKCAIVQRDGDLYRTAAHCGFLPELTQYAKEHPLRPDRGSMTGRAALEGRAIHVPDVLADPEYTASGYQSFGYRTALAVPLLREGATIGVFVLTRDTVNPFTDKQIELVATFADQAVIAIENVRLFEAEQQRTQELSESLQQQTAASEVLRVISSSPSELDPIFQAILANGARLCAGGWRREEIVGMLVVRRRTPGAFPPNIVDLMKTFAAQSALAIENERLFNNVETSLKDLRTAQDRLVQTEKLASLGQLTAGIAHEIKNPLNFVNNFSAVSVELIDELREALGGAHFDSKLRAEVAGIADMLQGNLDKVVPHGKRADSIVKNMLLHSRQGSGEHRPVDINALVEESLNLAYHGASAKKQGFNITLERSFDPAAGEVDLFPQEITRVPVPLSRILISTRSPRFLVERY